MNKCFWLQNQAFMFYNDETPKKHITEVHGHTKGTSIDGFITFLGFTGCYCCPEFRTCDLSNRSPVPLGQKSGHQAQGSDTHYTLIPIWRVLFSLERHHRLHPHSPHLAIASQLPRPVSTMPHHPWPPAMACIWADTSDTKCCDSTESGTCDLSHRSPAS